MIFQLGRYKGRLYDSCVNLEASNLGSNGPWCSTFTDSLGNHVPGTESQCPSTCPWTNCPVGFYRAVPDESCYQVSPVWAEATHPDFDGAKEACQKQGARLYEPR